MPETEKQLIEQVKLSNRDAFRQLFELYHPKLYRHLFYQCRDESLAQDMAQETFFKVWTVRDTLKSNHSFYAFVCRIGDNLLKDHYKYQKVRVQHREKVELHWYSDAVNPEDEVQVQLLKEILGELVERHLPEKCRAVFTLSRVEELSNQEIADMMQTSKKTVENQLHHALKIIRKKIEKYV